VCLQQGVRQVSLCPQKETHPSALQCVAVSCSVFAVGGAMSLAESSRGVSSIRVATCGSVLQRVAVFCNVFAALG